MTEFGTVTDERDLGLFVPSEIDDYGLDPFEFRLYSRIARRAGANGKCNESLPNMAKRCSMSLHKARQSVRLLEAAGLIRGQQITGKSIEWVLCHKRNWKHPEQLQEIRATLTKHPTPTKYDTPTKSDRGNESGGTRFDRGVVPDLIGGGTRFDRGVVPDLVPKGTPIKVLPLRYSHEGMSHASRCDERGVEQEGENLQESEPVTESVTVAATVESEVIATSTVAGEDQGSGRKKTKKNQAPQYSAAFERWWRPDDDGGYYNFALDVNVSPGLKQQAWKEFHALWGDGEPSADFLEGDAYYQESKRQQFGDRGQAVGVPHGCRYVRDGKWQEALDHKRRRADKPQLSKRNQQVQSIYERTLAVAMRGAAGGSNGS